jgi:hypothetical protein
MKTRTGFVSNSSTSSFCLWGFEIEESDVNFEDEDDRSYYNAHEFFTKNGIDCVCDSYDQYGFLVGLSPADMKEDETLAQFKVRVVDSVNKLGKLNLKVEDIDYYLGTMPE